MNVFTAFVVLADFIQSLVHMGWTPFGIYRPEDGKPVHPRITWFVLQSHDVIPQTRSVFVLFFLFFSFLAVWNWLKGVVSFGKKGVAVLKL